jgi:hypothetical protein
MQGEEFFHYYHIEHENLDCVLHNIGIKLFLLEREKKVVQAQLEKNGVWRVFHFALNQYYIMHQQHNLTIVVSLL